MDKLVYLYELDSTCTSPAEILRGQRALFEEIVLHGNRVVLTFNQLTDSLPFLSAIRDPETYPHILELFRLGALKVSRFAPPGFGEDLDPAGQEALGRQVDQCREEYGPLFRDGVLKSYPPLPGDAPQRVLRTASHYVQNAVEKCLNDDNDSFLFSALPFRSRDKEVLSALSYALQYSDPSVLDACAGAFSFGEEEAATQERLDYVKRFVEMILLLSREPLAANPAKLGRWVSFTDTLERIFRLCAPLEPREEDPVSPLLPQTLELLRELRDTAFGPGSSIQNRSNWHRALYALDPSPQAQLAEAVVDLCYNYTMEASISGISRHYRDDATFFADFLCRLRLAWADIRSGVHTPQKGDRRTLARPQKLPLPHWDTAVRLLRSSGNGQEVRDGLYEDADARERRSWRVRMGRSLLKQVCTAGVYFALFLGSSLLLELLEDSLSAQMGAQLQLSGPALSVCNILLFGLLGSAVSALTGLPDILDNTKDFFHTLRDAGRLLSAPRGNAYYEGMVKRP